MEMFSTKELNKVTYYAKACAQANENDLLDLEGWRCASEDKEWWCSLSRNRVVATDFAFLTELEGVLKELFGDVVVMLTTHGCYEDDVKMCVSVRIENWEEDWRNNANRPQTQLGDLATLVALKKAMDAHMEEGRELQQAMKDMHKEEGE